MPVVRMHQGEVLLHSVREGSQELTRITRQAEGTLLRLWRRALLGRLLLRLFLGCFFTTDLTG